MTNAVIGALRVNLGLDTAAFQNGLRQIERESRKVAGIGPILSASVAGPLAAVGASLALVGAGLAKVVRDGDRIRQLEGRFKALTDSAERASDLLAGSFEAAFDAGTDLESVAQIVTRFRIAADSIGATDEEVLRLTESISKLGVIGGGTTQEIAAGGVQLGQALASGRLQGDELRSIMESLPLVAVRLAEGLGVSVGELKEMGSEGRLLSRDVFAALLRQSEAIDKQFSELPETMATAGNRLSTAVTRFNAGLNESLGLSLRISAALGAAADHIERVNKARAAALAPDEQVKVGEATFRRGDLDDPNLRDKLGFALGDPRGADVAEGRVSYFSSPAPRGFIGPPLVTRGPTPTARPSFTEEEILAAERAAERTGGGAQAATDAYAELVAQIAESNVERVNELQLVGLTGVAREKAALGFEAERVAQDLANAAAKVGRKDAAALGLEIELTVAEYVRLRETLIDAEAAQVAQAEAMEAAARRAEETQAAIEAMADGFAGAISRADSFAGALRNVGLELAELALRGAFGLGPLGPSLSLVGGGGAGAGSLFDLFGFDPFAFADGGAIVSGRVKAFARGGIVSAPTAFAMEGGLGLMGEAGAEAILPLSRGRGGRLGVEASGLGRPISVTVNVTTPDAESFRRSSGQIAAEMSRAIERARRDR